MSKETQTYLINVNEVKDDSAVVNNKGSEINEQNIHINHINEVKNIKLRIYILGYLLVYMISGLLFSIGMIIYSTKIISGGFAINQNAIMQAIKTDHSLPMWDIAFVVFGLFVVLSIAVLHWFIKKRPNLSWQ